MFLIKQAATQHIAEIERISLGNPCFLHGRRNGIKGNLPRRPAPQFADR